MHGQKKVKISSEVCKSAVQGDLFYFSIRNEWLSLTFT